jgi:hypothetical protein
MRRHSAISSRTRSTKFGVSCEKVFSGYRLQVRLLPGHRKTLITSPPTDLFMILEERVIFTDKESAAEFVSYLRKSGCPCQKTVQGITGTKDLISGTLEQAVALCEAEAGRCEHEGSTEEAAAFRDAEAYHRRIIAKAEEIMAGKAPGDLIVPKGSIPADLLKFLVGPDGRTGEDAEEAPSPDLPDTLLRPLVLGMLLEGQVLVEDETGWVLGSPVRPGDLCTQFDTDTLPPIEPDALRGMTREVTVVLLEVHVVVADPLVHIVCDPDEVMEFLEDLSVADEVLDAVEDSMVTKGLIVARLFEEIEKERGVSVRVLTERLNGNVVEVPDLPVPARLKVDEEAVAAIVAELRKRDVLAGTDLKVRIAGGRWRRK